MVGKCGLGIHPIFDDNVGKVGSIRFTRARVDAAGASTAMTTAQVVNAYDEESICVDGLARADTGVPPAWFCVILLMQSCRMVTTDSA